MADRVVVLFVGHSQYDSLNTMVGQLSGALQRQGASTLVLDTRATDCVATAVALIRPRSDVREP